MGPSTVRIATEKDRLDIWRLMLQSHAENGIFQLDPLKVDWWLTRMLQPGLIPEWDVGPRGAIGVIGQVGTVEGMCIVAFSTYWYTSERHLEELLVVVDPECRKSGHAKALIEWMKEQSGLLGMPLVTGVISNHRTEAKCRLYGRMLPKVGEFFLYNQAERSSVGAG